jgi:hypothetical protein
MGLLPGAHPLGILLIPEIILVLRLGQPAALGLSLSGSVALSLVAVVLMVPIAKIGKKKFLAVVALTLTPRSLHRFQNQKQPLFGKLAREPEENPSGRRLSERRRKKNIRRIDRRKSTGRRSTSRLAVLIQFQFSGDSWVSTRLMDGKLCWKAIVPGDPRNSLRHNCHSWMASSTVGRSLRGFLPVCGPRR